MRLGLGSDRRFGERQRRSGVAGRAAKLSQDACSPVARLEREEDHMQAASDSSLHDRKKAVETTDSGSAESD